jgi:uncharacterized protein (DUF4213/DUF364 family)
MLNFLIESFLSQFEILDFSFCLVYAVRVISGRWGFAKGVWLLQMVDYAPMGTGIASSLDINLEGVTREFSNAISNSTLDTSRLRFPDLAID